MTVGPVSRFRWPNGSRSLRGPALVKQHVPRRVLMAAVKKARHWMKWKKVRSHGSSCLDAGFKSCVGVRNRLRQFYLGVAFPAAFNVIRTRIIMYTFRGFARCSILLTDIVLVSAGKI